METFGEIFVPLKFEWVDRLQEWLQAMKFWVIGHLERYGMTGSVAPVENVLHLKTGVAYLEHGNLVVGGEFRSRTEFQKLDGGLSGLSLRF